MVAAKPKDDSYRIVTAKDVAAFVGVSQTSVAIVLNGSKSNSTVSEATRNRILEAANQLGYRRNGMAAAIRTGKFGSIGLLQAVDSNTSGLPPRVLEGIHRELELRGTHLIVHRLPIDALGDSLQLPKVLREWTCDGLVADITYKIPPQLEEAIEKSKLPTVWWNVLREFDAVRPDDYMAGRQAARHLLELGHRRICYLDLGHSWSEVRTRGAESLNHYSAHDRYAGVRDELDGTGCELVVQLQDEGFFDPSNLPDPRVDFEKSCRYIKQVLVEHKPTAIITYDEVGYATLAVARDLGLEVPRDLSMIGFGSIGRPCFLGHRVTAMTLPEEEMGRRLIQILCDKIEQPGLKVPETVLPFGFDPRNTCDLPRTK